MNQALDSSGVPLIARGGNAQIAANAGATGKIEIEDPPRVPGLASVHLAVDYGAEQDAVTAQRARLLCDVTWGVGGGAYGDAQCSATIDATQGQSFSIGAASKASFAFRWAPMFEAPDAPAVPQVIRGASVSVTVAWAGGLSSRGAYMTSARIPFAGAPATLPAIRRPVPARATRVMVVSTIPAELANLTLQLWQTKLPAGAPVDLLYAKLANASDWIPVSYSAGYFDLVYTGAASPIIGLIWELAL